MRTFAAQSGIWENPGIALVKSSLVFVLVEGYQLVALYFCITQKNPDYYITPMISSTDLQP